MSDYTQSTNAEKLNQVISDNLFPEVQHISDVKQVLEEMENKGQEFREDQLKAQILLSALGDNEYLHQDSNPYEPLLKFMAKAKIDVVNPDFYIDTIESLIPKPPKPIVLAEKDGKR